MLGQEKNICVYCFMEILNRVGTCRSENVFILKKIFWETIWPNREIPKEYFKKLKGWHQKIGSVGR